MDEITVKKFYDKKTREGFVTEEWDIIRNRRKRLGIEEEQRKTKKPLTKVVESDLLDKPPFDMFGLALSGGGIRSATFNLGFVKALNEKGIFKYADYLSTVSGGGYTGGFIQQRLKDNQNYNELFTEEEMKYLKEHGDYLRPGKGIIKFYESLNFYINTVVLIILNSIWYILFFAFAVFALIFIGVHIPNVSENIYNTISLLLVIVLAWYYFFHSLRYIHGRLWSSKILFYSISSLILLFSLAAYTRIKPSSLPSFFENLDSVWYLLLFAFIVFVIGLFADPNILSLHRFYRFRLKDAFPKGSNDKIHEMLSPSENEKKGEEEVERWTVSPYPLINTTLNLQGGKAGETEEVDGADETDEANKDIAGMKSCDYFLFSPLYCGSKLTGYIPTDKGEYSRITLATAMTISGASLNPNMGYKSNRFFTFFMTLLNIRLGYWILNPKIYEEGVSLMDEIAAWFGKSSLRHSPTLWPFYNFAELFGNMNLNRIRVNLSDGGHIENMAVFELLRRKCKLIIASDAGADPDYAFSDLRNLLMRAKNELEIAIEFSDDQDPGKIIRPNLRTGYARRSYVIGKIYQLAETETEDKKKLIGYFVYVKASVTAQKRKPRDEEDNIYSYQNYHPNFPHESTADQFFDEAQWHAYETLGEEIANDLFKDFTGTVSVQNLIDYFKQKEYK